LNYPPLDTLLALKRTGLATALSEPMALPASQALSVAERLGLLVDREMTARSDRRLTTRLRQATWRLSASLEAIDSRHPRGLDQAVRARLATCQWVRAPHNVFITGPTGMGHRPGPAVAAPAPGAPSCQGRRPVSETHGLAGQTRLTHSR
jgi:IstB-like ATP binding protein